MHSNRHIWLAWQIEGVKGSVDVSKNPPRQLPCCPTTGVEDVLSVVAVR